MSDWVVEHGSQRLADAENAFAKAAELERAGSSEAESAAREALSVFRSAMNWLEDTDRFEEAHRRLDAAGVFVRRNFGCQLHQEGTYYEQRCPVALAHNRIGLSPGLVIRESQCSICGLSPADCAHVTGRTYDGEFCARRITKADVLEVSLVNRPSQPDARITAMSVDNAELAAALGPSWRPGVPVSCDRCLSPCDGVYDHIDGAGGIRGH